MLDLKSLVVDLRYGGPQLKLTTGQIPYA
jgi:hypothetical protein